MTTCSPSRDLELTKHVMRTYRQHLYLAALLLVSMTGVGACARTGANPDAMATHLNVVWQKACMASRSSSDPKSNPCDFFGVWIRHSLESPDDVSHLRILALEPPQASVPTQTTLDPSAQACLNWHLFTRALDEGDASSAARHLAALDIDSYCSLDIECIVVDPQFSSLGVDGILVVFDAIDHLSVPLVRSSLLICVCRAFPQFAEEKADPAAMVRDSRAWFMANRAALIVDPWVLGAATDRAKDGSLFIFRPPVGPSDAGGAK